MQQALKRRSSYYAALSIFFGAIELFIPKLLPFFRLGIANIPILLALDMPPAYFMLLVVLKGIGNSYVQGNLFSVFGAISILQSLGSGFSMYLMRKISKEKISLYGLSALGALVSSAIQMLLASLYVGMGVMAFLFWMLLISLLSSILVAFFSYRLEIPEYPPNIDKDGAKKEWEAIPIITLIISAGIIMVAKGWIYALVLFALALLFQSCTHRKIKIVPYILITLFMIISSLFTPTGRVLFRLGSYPFTQGAILGGLEKGLKLSAAVAISQGYSTVIRPAKGIIGDTLCYFTSLLTEFRDTKGRPFLERVNATLSLKELKYTDTEKQKTRYFVLILFSLMFLYVSIQSIVLSQPI